MRGDKLIYIPYCIMKAIRFISKIVAHGVYNFCHIVLRPTYNEYSSSGFMPVSVQWNTAYKKINCMRTMVWPVIQLLNEKTLNFTHEHFLPKRTYYLSEKRIFEFVGEYWAFGIRTRVVRTTLISYFVTLGFAFALYLYGLCARIKELH